MKSKKMSKFDQLLNRKKGGAAVGVVQVNQAALFEFSNL